MADGVDANGNQRYRQEWHTMAGGHDGSRGNSGGNGQDGSKGSDGTAGNFIMRVFSTKGGRVDEYRSVFNLRLASYAAFTSETGIVEPGQRLVAKGFTVKNIGGMPSPTTGELSEFVMCH